jgi:hypothetical protein
MKHVVSISLGSSRRNHKVVQDFCGQSIAVERLGTDGDRKKAIQLIRELDGQVDAFGLGGTDLYIYAGGRRYTFRESAHIAAAARRTPIVDGSGVKNTLERRVVNYLAKTQGVLFENRPALVVCAVDRFGLAEALVQAGSKVVFGDLLFGLGLPIPIRSLSGLARLARIAAPVVTKLPIHFFYPIGGKQTVNTPRFSSYFNEAEVVAGDFHFIRRYMPLSLTGKTLITNTVTAEDQALLKERGVATLVTTTPDMGGRSFGTNVLEAVLVALAGKGIKQLLPEEYEELLNQLQVHPRITRFS